MAHLKRNNYTCDDDDDDDNTAQIFTCLR